MRREGQRSGDTALGYPMACDHAADQHDNPKDAGASNRDFPRVAFEHPEPHDECDGNRHPDGEHSPRAVRQSIDDHDSESCQRDQENEQDRDHCDQSRERADLGARNVRQRTSTMAHRRDQHHKVLYTTCQDRSHQDPKKAGCESELGREGRSHQGTGAGDGGEVMSEQHPTGRDNIVVPVRIEVSGRRPAVVKRQCFSSNVCAVVAVRQSIDTQRAYQNRKCVHGAGSSSLSCGDK